MRYSLPVCVIALYSILVLALHSPLSAAQISTINPSNNFAYAANAGWIDFRPSEDDGVRVGESFVSGNAYAANFGWINFGDGNPDNGFSYSNTTDSDFGVNVSDEGKLSGYAYSANIGWICFEQTFGNPQLSFESGRIIGCAYAANIGWISFDTPSSSLAVMFLAFDDTDSDGIADAWEMQHFGNLTAAGGSNSDADKDGISDLAEYLAGSDPNDSSSALQIVDYRLDYPNKRNYVTFESVPNRRYQIQKTENLNGAWTDAGLGIFGSDFGRTTERDFGFTTGSRLFLRVIAHKPLQSQNQP